MCRATFGSETRGFRFYKSVLSCANFEVTVLNFDVNLEELKVFAYASAIRHIDQRALRVAEARRASARSLTQLDLSGRRAALRRLEPADRCTASKPSSSIIPLQTVCIAVGSRCLLRGSALSSRPHRFGIIPFRFVSIDGKPSLYWRNGTSDRRRHSRRTPGDDRPPQAALPRRLARIPCRGRRDG